MPTAPATREAPLAAPPREVVLATQTRAVYGQGFAGTFANLAVTAVTVALMWSEVDTPWRFAPLVGVLFPLLVRVLSRRPEPTDAELLRWRGHYLMSMLASGLAWGATIALLLPVLDSTYQVFLTVIAIGLSAGGLATLGEVLAVYLAFVVPLLLGTVVTIGFAYHHHPAALAALIGLYAVILIKTSIVHSRSLEEVLKLSLTNAALVEELAEATDAAQAASRAKSEFLARMSHELRTPMNGILGTTDLLREAELPPREHHLADVAHSSSALLLTLLNDVLDMASIEAGRIELSDEPLSVEAVLEDVATLLCVTADQLDLTLVCHAAPNVPRLVMGDETRLRQILTNLAGNALKFTEAGEVEVRARLDAGSAGEELVIAVRDTGVGIPADQHEAIFHAFEQASEDVGLKRRGTGLGLAISARLARLMGGSIRVESEVGAGSTFTLRLPCRRVPDTEPSEPEPTAPLSGRRALLFVPQPLEREALSLWLSEEGAEVVACVTAEALADARGAADVVVVEPLGLPEGATVASAVGDRPTVVLQRPSTTLGPLGELSAEAQVLPRPLRRRSVVAAVEAALRIARAPTAPEGAAGAPAVGRVLVVDDDEVNRLVARRILEKLGIEVHEADSGLAALEAMTGGAFDVALMDCEMPGIDGLETTRRARARDVRGRIGARLPIIAVTAHVMPERHAACHAAGMDDVVIKPISRAHLEAVVTRYLPATGTSGATG